MVPKGSERGMPFLCRLRGRFKSVNSVATSQMWTRLATFILRRRAPLLFGLAVITGLMAWKGQDARLMYKFGGLLPEDAP